VHQKIGIGSYLTLFLTKKKKWPQRDHFSAVHFFKRTF